MTLPSRTAPASASPVGLGTVGGVALFVTAVVGPGILTLPAAAAATAGPASLIALGCLLAMSIPAAFAFVSIHRASQQIAPGADSGIHTYVTQAFGPTAGRIVGAWFFLGVPIGVPALALIGGSYVSAAVGGGRPVTLVTAWILVAVAVSVTAAGRHAGGTLSLVLALLLVGLIVGAAIVSVPHWQSDRITTLAPNGWLALLPASLTLMWVLTGWEASANFTAMLREPDRRLARVIGLTLVVVIVLYGCVSVPELLVLGPYAGHTSAPLAAVLRAAIGAPASLVAAVLAAVLALANSVAYLSSLRELGRSFLGASGRRSPRTDTRMAVIVPAAVTVLGLAVASVVPLDADTFVRLCAASQIPVYVAALAGGLMLVPKWTKGWWTCLGAASAVSLLLVPAGPYLVVPLAIAAGVLLVDRIHRIRPRDRTLVE